MKKIISFYILGLIIWFLIGKFVDIGSIFFTQNVTICNNSEYDFHSFEINKDHLSQSITQWTCKEINTYQLKDNKVSMKIYVHKDNEIFIFESKPTDNIWKKKIAEKNIEISINELNKGEKYMTEYIDSIKFQILEK